LLCRCRLLMLFSSLAPCSLRCRCCCRCCRRRRRRRRCCCCCCCCGHEWPLRRLSSSLACSLLSLTPTNTHTISLLSIFLYYFLILLCCFSLSYYRLSYLFRGLSTSPKGTPQAPPSLSPSLPPSIPRIHPLGRHGDCGALSWRTAAAAAAIDEEVDEPTPINPPPPPPPPPPPCPYCCCCCWWWWR